MMRIESAGSSLQRLQDFADAGLDEICLRLHDDPADSIRIIGRHVIPRFGGG